MQLLKQSTTTTILVGPVLDSAGAAVTTAVLANFSITKNGTVAVLTGATVAHDHNGHYTIALTTGNTDTLGRLTITINNSAMAMAPFRYSVLTAAAFDAIITNGTLASTTSGRTISVDVSGNLTLSDGSITAAKIAAAALNGKGDWSTYAGGDTTGTTTLLSRLGAPVGASISADIAAVKSDTEGLVTSLASLAGKFTGITLLADWLRRAFRKDSGTAGMATAQTEINTGGTAAFDGTTDSLESIKDNLGSGGSGSGTGARTVMITVNDGTTALQNAIVRMSEGASSYTATTNASGVATFNLDDAAYTVSITKQGYTYAGTTLVVDGTESQTYSMTQISITPGSGSATTGYVTCLDNTGTAEADVTVFAQMIDPPASGTGYAYDASVRTVTSDEDGVAELTGMTKGATYQLWRGKRASGRTVTIPSDAGSTYALPSLVGE